MNFRSTQEIIKFSENIKPIQTSKSLSATNKSGNKVTIMIKSIKELHQFILYFIECYGEKKDLSNVAIICPTRGIKAHYNLGLSIIFNLLRTNNIPINQLYDESGAREDMIRRISRIPGHVNLLTYHGTKGLEFDVVFVVDFYQNLFNKLPSEEDHKKFQYLLYVATTRAISYMFVCVYSDINGGMLNNWLTKVPKDCFVCDGPFKIDLRPPIDRPLSTYGITEILSGMPDIHLDMIYDILNIKDNPIVAEKRIYKDFSHINRKNDEAFFGIFCEELFYLQYNLSKRFPLSKLEIVENILKSNYVIINNSRHFSLLHKYVITNKLNWMKFDFYRDRMPPNVVQLVEKYFDRRNELNEYTVYTNEFFEIVKKNIPAISSAYYKYLDPSKYNYSYKKILEDFFYLVLVQFSHNNNHFCYIDRSNRDKQYLLCSGSEMFKCMNKYVKNHYHFSTINSKIPVHYDKLFLRGEIDFIERSKMKCKITDNKLMNDKSTNDKTTNDKTTNDKTTSNETTSDETTIDETIVEIKCSKEISIKYYAQLILYNFCYYYQKNRKLLYCNKFKILNLLTGLEYYIIITISPVNMFNLLIVMADIGNLYFNNLNLLCDLKFVTYSCKSIVNMAIKDYETDMVLIDTSECPVEIETIKLVLEKKMARFRNCNFLTYGSNEINEYLLKNKIVDQNTGTISFLDSKEMILSHLPEGSKIRSKLQRGCAMNNVNDTTKIMRRLNIEL